MRLFVKTLVAIFFICLTAPVIAQDAQTYIDRGDKAYNAGKLDEAIIQYTNAIKVDNKNSVAYCARGNAFGAKNDLAAAMQDFNKALQLDPENDEALAGRGNCYKFSNKPDEAINDFTAAIRVNPAESSHYTRRGEAYVMKQLTDLALQDFNTAINADPKDPDPVYQRGLIALGQSRIDDAVRDFSAAIKLEPAYGPAYSSRGQCYMIQSKWDAAMNDYTKYISMGNEDPFAYYARGYCYSSKFNYKQAITDLNKAIQLRGDYPDAYGARAYARSALQQYDQAIADYNMAIFLTSAQVVSGYFSGRAYCYSMKSEYDSAIADINIAISKDPDNPGLRNNRAFYYNSTGQYELSVKDYKRCIDQNDLFSSAYINIISPLTRLNRFQEAKSFYDLYQQKRLSSFLETPPYKFYKRYLTALGQVLNNQPDEALANLDKANNEYGSKILEESKRAYIDMMYLYAYVLEQQGNTEDALGFYEQSLSIDPRQPDVKAAMERITQKQLKASDTDKTPPEISFLDPREPVYVGSAKIQIMCRATDPAGIASVMVNNVKVNHVEEDGVFVAYPELKPGDNMIEVIATDNKGNTATSKFTVKGISGTNLSRGAEVTNNAEVARTSENAGTYHALFIANQDYNEAYWKKLQKPVSDALRLRDMLISKYSFNPENVDTLFNRSRPEILMAIQKAVRSLGKNDNLLIFYAGHGKGIPVSEKEVDGYLIGTDGTSDNFTWISTNDLKSAMKPTTSSPGPRHILLIADACFSGALTRGGENLASQGIQRVMEKKSRTAMTSGNLEEVPDESMFLKYLLQSLETNKFKFITASDLFSDFKDAVMNNTKLSQPLCRPIQDVGDEGGEFVFIKR